MASATPTSTSETLQAPTATTREGLRRTRDSLSFTNVKLRCSLYHLSVEFGIFKHWGCPTTKVRMRFTRTMENPTATLPSSPPAPFLEDETERTNPRNSKFHAEFKHENSPRELSVLLPFSIYKPVIVFLLLFSHSFFSQASLDLFTSILFQLIFKSFVSRAGPRHIKPLSVFLFSKNKGSEPHPVFEISPTTNNRVKQ